MPNKPHPPRNKPTKSGQASASTLNGEDTSFIVFGDGKPKRKNAKSTTTPALASASSGAGQGDKKLNTATVPSSADGSKKPDTRTLIGGASWTGKLPLNLFSEHCQRAKWEKPEYAMSRISVPTPGSHISGVILRSKNQKTGDITTLPIIQIPPEHKTLAARDTAVEARHFAACFALFRVASGKNLGMALPPAYRDLWKGEFADIKKAEIEGGRGWLYDADPFAAKARHEEEVKAREKARKDRDERIQRQQREREESRGIGGGKGWSRAPKIDMGKKMRSEVEKLVRSGTVWNVRGVILAPEMKRTIVEQVTEAGFRRAHVEEAVEECRDREEVLEWLMIHVPEDDLPKWCLPDNYTAGVSLASGDMQRENKIKRLAEAGYAVEVCAETLTAAGDDEVLAAEMLQTKLLSGDTTPTMEQDEHDEEEDDQEFWTEELDILKSIYDDRVHSSSSAGCKVELDLEGFKKLKIILNVKKPRRGYPRRPPILSIEANLPAYIRLSIVKQVLQRGINDFLGEQMVLPIIDWLEQHIPSIVENPGTLKSISSAIGIRNETTHSTTPHRRAGRRHHIPTRPSAEAGEQALAEWRARQDTQAQQKMLSIRRKLPAWDLGDTIVDCVNTSQVTIISGETGSGKSTQSVQFILDDMIKRKLGAQANIVCTQPRRISALGLADRVAEERCSVVGQEIGYAIRGESRQQAGVTKITFVTTGVLLRRLQGVREDEGGLSAALDGITHVVIDEVHERSLDTDFLMTLLRDVLQTRKDLKLILMSATLDAEFFERYYSSSATVSKVQIPGRTYPVTDVYLEDILRSTGLGGQVSKVDEDGDEDDATNIGAAIRAVGPGINYNLLADLVDYIDQQLTMQGDSYQGSILIFLPGVAEIDRTINAIRRVSSKFDALPLHASLLPAEQRRVFPRAQAGRRKIIAATNVAETSITIEDVVVVLDTGRVKEQHFDPQAGMVKLEEAWASKAACKQRRGRAGRVKAGTCYKLFTRDLERTRMAERPEPEIKRVPLEQLCLAVKAMGVVDVRHFLGRAITPPASLAVEAALSLLERMGILDCGSLTALGRHLALIPADLRCGKLMVLGSVFGCLDSCLIMASILSARSPFVSPPEKRDEAKAARAVFDRGGHGDLVCDLKAFQAWSEKRQGSEPASSLKYWCSQNFLSSRTLQDIDTMRRHYLATLKDIQFVPFNYKGKGCKTGASTPPAQNEDNPALLRALIAAAFSPQVARIEFPDAKYIASVSGAVALDPEARTIKYFTETTASTLPITGGNDTSPSVSASVSATSSTPATQGADAVPPRNERVFVHPSSTLFSVQSFPPNTAFISYFTKMATSKVFVRELTPVNAYALLLFCGSVRLAGMQDGRGSDSGNNNNNNNNYSNSGGGGGLLVDGWVRIRGWARIGVLISRLRAMLDELLGRKLEDPGLEIGDAAVVRVVRKLVELNGLDH